MFVAIALMAMPFISPPAVQAAPDSGTCPVPSSYASGTGIPSDPFLISTPGQLQRLRNTPADWNDSVRLTLDIEMGGCVWGMPIGAGVNQWAGSFDGGGHVVNGLDVVTNSGYAGFIGYMETGASIQDLGLTGDVSVTVTSSFAYVAAGALVGFTQNASISRSFATGDVSVVIAATPDPNDPFNPDDASASVNTGGLVGVSQGEISDSYATGSVDVTAAAVAVTGGSASVDNYGGGLVGNKMNGPLHRSYATGAVTSTLTANGGSSQVTSDRRGGLLGYRSLGQLNANVWDTATSGLATGSASNTPAGVTGFTTTQMTSYASFSSVGQNWSITDGFSDSTIWSICPSANSGYPVLSKFNTNVQCASSGSEIDRTMWGLSVVRHSAAAPCPSGYTSSWARWPNGATGGWVCNREVFAYRPLPSD